MKKILCLAGLMIWLVIGSLWHPVAAQKSKVPDPLPAGASLAVTRKWILHALKDNFLFHVPRDKKDKAKYQMRELKFEDCLLSFSIFREYPPRRLPAIIDAPAVPNPGSGTNPPRIPPSRPRPERPRGFIDYVAFDLAEIDPASLRIVQLSSSKAISHLIGLNRAVTAATVNEAMARTEMKPVGRAAANLTSQNKGGAIALREASAQTIKAGFEHAIKLCQDPSLRPKIGAEN